MLNKLKSLWAEVTTAYGSHTIWWARIKFFVGTAFWGVHESSADLSTVLTPHWLLVWQIISTWLVIDGVFSESLRRYKSQDLGQ